MPGTIDPTGWTATLTGVFAIFAAIGAFRQPRAWQTMIDELQRSPALQLIAGWMELALGAAIFLLNPWSPPDLLACAMKVIGGFMMAEALAVTAFSDLYFHFWLKSLGGVNRSWVVLTLIFGLVFAMAGIARFL